MEKLKIFNKILVLSIAVNFCIYTSAKGYTTHSKKIKTQQVFFNGLEGEKIGQLFNSKIYIKDSSDVEGCFYAHRENINGLSYKFIDNTLVEIEFNSKIFISPHGIYIGDSVRKLNKYSNKNRMVMKHPYGGGKDIIEFYWNGNLGVKYIISNGKIVSFSIGKKKELLYLEGCL